MLSLKMLIGVAMAALPSVLLLLLLYLLPMILAFSVWRLSKLSKADRPRQKNIITWAVVAGVASLAWVLLQVDEAGGKTALRIMGDAGTTALMVICAIFFAVKAKKAAGKS